MNKQDLLDVLQLYREMLAENEQYKRENKDLRDELNAVREELESLRKMIYSYGGKNA